MGEEVSLQIDEGKRRLYALYHSGGHLLDLALRQCGLGDLKPIKGYHFPKGAYVEYSGNIDAKKKDEVLETINQCLASLIQKSEQDVDARVLVYDEAKLFLGGSVPDYVKDPIFRVVKLLPEDSGYPCGGTHVKNVSDFKELKVNKINQKGKTTRFSYRAC